MDYASFSKEIDVLKKMNPQKEELVENAIEDAVVIFRHLINDETQDTFNDNERNWIKRCANELLINSSYSGVAKYSENGFSFEKYSSELSPLLLREIVPKVKML